MRQAPSSCPTCAAPVAGGRFCANCGSALEGVRCAKCDSPLTPGAKFCHRCGAAAGAMAPLSGARTHASPLPWAVAAIALVALVALVAGQNFKARTASTLDAPLNALPQPGLDDRGASMLGGAGGNARAPDISALSPRERADRLFDRIMRYHERGQLDSVKFFAVMAIPAYQMLDPMDADARYDLGRVAEVAGLVQLAKAQSDTILQRDPAHLLGLALATRTAHLSGDEPRARELERRLLAAAPSERSKQLPEYLRHQSDIAAAIKRARDSGLGIRDSRSAPSESAEAARP